MNYTTDEKIEIASLILSSYKDRNLNEADTRHLLIDEIIHNVLSWPKISIRCEEYANPGYIDYVLSNNSEDALLIIEAKKEGITFNIPESLSNNKFGFTSIKTIITDNNIKETVTQVKEYSIELGCEFACITNGHEWIFFKTFSKGKKWRDLNCFYIKSLSYFVDNFTESQNNFNYINILEKGSLNKLLNSEYPENRDIYLSKKRIFNYDFEIHSNSLSPILEPIAKKFFGPLKDGEEDFVNACYVSIRKNDNSSDKFINLTIDNLSPFFKKFGFKELVEDKKIGNLGQRINSSIRKNTNEVIILFGGKGAGKSTFAQRNLVFKPPVFIKKHVDVVFIDLLKIENNKEVVKQHIWTNIVESIDKEKILEQDRRSLINNLYKDKFQIASKQDLYGIDTKSTEFNIRLNQLVTNWKSDKIDTSIRLIKYYRNMSKTYIIVVDNTDQLTREIQDYCFSLTQDLSKRLECLVVLNMREERFYNSNIHGILDAYQTPGLHISAPIPKHVFTRRLDYILNIISDKSRFDAYFENLDFTELESLTDFLKIIRREFDKNDSHLVKFLKASAQGDIRFSLELFSKFISSGYLNILEIIPNKSFTFLIHQVLKPMMIPYRYYYDEELSNIPNIFKIRSSNKSSHFTSIRILDYFRIKTSSSKSAYMILPPKTREIVKPHLLFLILTFWTSPQYSDSQLSHTI
jgi:hypothetical protein